MAQNDFRMPKLTSDENSGIHSLHLHLGVALEKIARRRILSSEPSRRALLFDTIWSAHKMVTEHFDAIPVSRKAVVATALYWRYDDIVVHLAIAESLGVRFGGLSDHLYLYPMMENCSCCGRDIMIFRRNRDEVLDNLTCGDCAPRSTANLKLIPYSEYLRSDHWMSVREEALRRADRKCQACNSTSTLHVHHRTYERRGEELPSDLIVLCAKCHGLFHANGQLAGSVK